MKIILLGTHGQLGSQLYAELKKTDHTVVGLSRFDCDFNNFLTLKERIIKFLPDLIINTAAYTHVDDAETNKEAAYQINAVLPLFLAECCEKIHAKLIHFSTDYVFDGNKDEAYTETDIANPINYYGYSKHRGEEVINFPHVYVIRTGWLYSHVGRNFFLAIRSKLAGNQRVAVVDDQIGVPCSVQFLVKKIKSIITLIDESLYEIKLKPGIYHLVPSGQASWYDFSRLISESVNQDVLNQIEPIRSCDMCRAASRPSFSVLNTDKLVQCLGEPMPSWQAVYHDFYKEMNYEA